MPGAFTYDEATNKAVVTNGTSGAPATFNDMYLADQAGTGTDLLPAEAGTSGPGNSLTYAIRPTHDKALKIKCIVAAKTAEVDYIFITGTDAWGDAQTESLDVTAGNGTYTTTKRFATITEFDCSDNAAGGGAQWADGTIQVTQDIWGVVWEHVVDGQYKIDCNVDFGDGSTASYFTSLNEMVYFTYGNIPFVAHDATCQLGELQGDYGINGSIWAINPDATAYLSGPVSSEPTWLLYDSTFKILTPRAVLFDEGTLVIVDSTFEGYDRNVSAAGFSFKSGLSSLLFRGVSFRNLYSVGIERLPIEMSDVHLHYTESGFSLRGSTTLVDSAVTEASVREYLTSASIPTALIIQDPKVFVGVVTIQNDDYTIVVQYTTNIHITDKDGADLQSVAVDCEYAHLVEGTDAKTYKCIQDHASVDATHKPITGSDWASFWELYDAAGGLGGDWQTTFDFKASTQEFATQTTDANGDITEQVIQYKKWTTTSELLEARIHKFTYTHASYPDFVMSDVIVDHPLVWEHDMGQSTSDLTAIIQNAQVDDDGSPISLAGAFKLLLSTLTGKSSGGGTDTIVFRAVDDSKDRISATVDSDGNRTAIGARDSS